MNFGIYILEFFQVTIIHKKIFLVGSELMKDGSQVLRHTNKMLIREKKKVLPILYLYKVINFFFFFNKRIIIYIESQKLSLISGR